MSAPTGQSFRLGGSTLVGGSIAAGGTTTTVAKHVPVNWHDYVALSIKWLLILGYVLTIWHIFQVFMRHYDDSQRLLEYKNAHEHIHRCPTETNPDWIQHCVRYGVVLSRAYWIETLRLTMNEEAKHFAFNILGIGDWFAVGTFGQVQMAKWIEGITNVWQAVTNSVGLVITTLAIWALMTTFALFFNVNATRQTVKRKQIDAERQRQKHEQELTRAHGDFSVAQYLPLQSTATQDIASMYQQAKLTAWKVANHL